MMILYNGLLKGTSRNDWEIIVRMYVSDPSIIQMEPIVGLVFVMPQDLIISYSFANI